MVPITTRRSQKSIYDELSEISEKGVIIHLDFSTVGTEQHLISGIDWPITLIVQKFMKLKAIEIKVLKSLLALIYYCNKDWLRQRRTYKNRVRSRLKSCQFFIADTLFQTNEAHNAAPWISNVQERLRIQSRNHAKSAHVVCTCSCKDPKLVTALGEWGPKQQTQVRIPSH